MSFSQSKSATDVPRPEYPRPQWVRNDWLCLNGPWEFETDQGDSGLGRGLLERPLKDRIVVPFCPESTLSGIGNTDYLNAVWYRREVTIPAEWEGRRVLLHFQASDYDTFVWANGREVGRHRGGMTPFSCDLTTVATPGEPVTLVVRVRDCARDRMPSGKQAFEFQNSGCLYTRTTGIWQTVWLEALPLRAHLERPKIVPDVEGRRFWIEQPVTGAQTGLHYRARLRAGADVLAEADTRCGGNFYPRLELVIPEERVRLWSPEDPFLYDLDFFLVDEDGQIQDHATSYAGLRSVAIDAMAVKLNGQAVFQRLVLDQGFYPDGIMTAPSEEALIRDILLSKEAGFNGARLHQKVFEERFLYHADRLGYLVWGEFSDWGSSRYCGENLDFSPTYVTQWIEALRRDFNHPAIVGWCPMNESQERVEERITTHDDAMRGMFLATKLYDATRPVLDVSGYCHRVAEADIYDSHDYEQNPALFALRHDAMTADAVYANDSERIGSVGYNGQPYFVSEFGGIRWNPSTKADSSSWGYGDGPKTLEEFYERFEGLCRALLGNPRMFGYCYTQLTDVFQEQNGIYGFDRCRKFDPERLRAAQQCPAAIEQAQTPVPEVLARREEAVARHAQQPAAK